MRDYAFEPSFGNRPKNLVGREKYLEFFRDSIRTSPGSRERAVLAGRL